MEPLFAVAVGAILAMAVYLLLSRNVVRIALGLLLFSNGINLSIFTAGRLGRTAPPILHEGQLPLGDIANPLPQAMILTAIVISFALTTFTVVLYERAYRSMKTLDTNKMRVAEPPAEGETKKESA